MRRRTSQKDLSVLQMYETISLKGTGNKLLTYVNLETSSVYKTKGKGTVYKHRILLHKVVSHRSVG